MLRAQPRCTHVHRISVYSFWCVHHNKYIFIDGWYKFYMTVKRNDMCLTQILCSSRNKTLFTNTRKLLFVLLDTQLNICFACCTVHWITFCWVLLTLWNYKSLYWTIVEWSWHQAKLILLSLEQFTLMLLETPQLFPRFVMWEYQRQLKMKTSTFD